MKTRGEENETKGEGMTMNAKTRAIAKFKRERQDNDQTNRRVS
jgi:hypothetical protein